MRIGFTERGDAGLDFSWIDQVRNNKSNRGQALDGAILITKRMSKRFVDEVLSLHAKGKKLIIHCGCTGWGSSWLEPNVPAPEEQLAHLASLIEGGFPEANVVLRVDPIIPTPDGIAAFWRVVNAAKNTKLSDESITLHSHYDGQPVADNLHRNLLSSEIIDFDNKLLTQTLRWRISVFDEYKHVKRRLRALGHEPFYGPSRFQATDTEFSKLLDTFEQLPYYDGASGEFRLETCAELSLIALDKKRKAHHPESNYRLIARGCLSEMDLRILGIDPKLAPTSINGQNRRGCLCLTAKEELLNHCCQCANRCAYCYWQGDYRSRG